MFKSLFCSVYIERGRKRKTPLSNDSNELKGMNGKSIWDKEKTYTRKHMCKK